MELAGERYMRTSDFEHQTSERQFAWTDICRLVSNTYFFHLFLCTQRQAFDPGARAEQGLAAVADHYGTGDVGSGFTGEEQREFRDVIFCAEAAQRDAPREGVADLLVRCEALHAFCVVDGTGDDGIHADPFRAPLDGECAGDHVDPGLRRADV